MVSRKEKRLPPGTTIIVPNQRADLVVESNDTTEVRESPKRKGKSDFEETLFGPKGIESLIDSADRLNISGKQGDEIKDLKSLLCFYADFFHRTFPKMTRQDVLLHLLKYSNKGLHHISKIADDDNDPL